MNIIIELTYPVDWVVVVLSICCVEDVEEKYNSETDIVRHQGYYWTKLSIVDNEHPTAKVMNDHSFFWLLNWVNLENINILETASRANLKVSMIKVRLDKAPFFSVFLKLVLVFSIRNSLTYTIDVMRQTWYWKKTKILWRSSLRLKIPSNWRNLSTISHFVCWGYSQL